MRPPPVYRKHKLLPSVSFTARENRKNVLDAFKSAFESLESTSSGEAIKSCMNSLGWFLPADSSQDDKIHIPALGGGKLCPDVTNNPYRNLLPYGINELSEPVSSSSTASSILTESRPDEIPVTVESTPMPFNPLDEVEAGTPSYPVPGSDSDGDFPSSFPRRTSGIPLRPRSRGISSVKYTRVRVQDSSSEEDTYVSPKIRKL